MFVWAIAANEPSSIEPTAISQMTCCHSSTSPTNGPISTRTRSATAAIFGATEKNAVTGVAAPSHTSGVHRWNGTATTLKARPAAMNTSPTTNPTGGAATEKRTSTRPAKCGGAENTDNQ